MNRVAHVLWHSRGGMRRHVRTLAAHPPPGWTTSAVFGPKELAGYFAGLPFEPITRSRAFVAGRDADVVHAHGVNAGVTALVPAGPPVVLTLHVVVGGSGATARGRIAPTLARLVAGRADAVIAVSDAAADGFPHARVIAPAVDELPPPTTGRDDVRQTLGARDDDVIAVVVSRLELQKRLDLFVRAVTAAECTGWIVGDGPERAGITAFAAGRSVRLLGYREDVSDVLGASDIFAFPSASESYGIAVAEAIRAGLPVVATRTGAIPEIVRDAGVLVDVDDEEGFIGAVKRLVATPSERTRLATAARQVRPPDRDALIARVGEVYDELTR